MKSSIFVATFALLVGCLDSGCSDRGTESTEDEQVLSLRVEPESGRIGTVVSISNGPFIVPAKRNNEVSFPGASEALLSDSGSQTTIFSFVPFGAISGPITVRNRKDVAQTQGFQVTETVETARMTVAWYDLSAPITGSDSSVVDLKGIRRTWAADVHGDTIHVHRGYSTGDEYYEYHMLLLNKGDGQLPASLSMWTYIMTDFSYN